MTDYATYAKEHGLLDIGAGMGEEEGEDIAEILRAHGRSVDAAGFEDGEEGEEVLGEDGKPIVAPGDVKAVRRRPETYGEKIVNGPRGISALHYLSWEQTGRGRLDGEAGSGRSVFSGKRGREVADLDSLWLLWRGWAQRAHGKETLEDMLTKHEKLSSKKSVRHTLELEREKETEWLRRGEADAPREIKDIALFLSPTSSSASTPPHSSISTRSHPSTDPQPHSSSSSASSASSSSASSSSASSSTPFDSAAPGGGGRGGERGAEEMLLEGEEEGEREWVAEGLQVLGEEVGGGGEVGGDVDLDAEIRAAMEAEAAFATQEGAAAAAAVSAAVEPERKEDAGEQGMMEDEEALEALRFAGM